MATARSFEYVECSGTYEDELFDLFSSSGYMERIKAKAIAGSLKTIRFRSLCWKLFLGVLPEDGKQWITVTKESRNHYEELLEKFHVDPRSKDVDDISIDNPLSTSDLSPWNKYFDDQRLRQIIHQDVVRTFPDIEFFRSSEIQRMMINILFVFAREHKSIDYKQGMHELLAPILLVIHTDTQFYLKAAETDDLEMQVHIMLNQNYLEHDAYFMFCNVMERVEPWYIMDCNYYEVEERNIMPNRRRTLCPKESLPSTMHFIWFNHCRSFDPDLYTHLTTLEIAPQMYGIRWLRLLFGREFVIEDLLALWDAIFADNEDFELYKYIFAAMLISIRHLLIRGNYTCCLNHLMHFPHEESVQFIIDLALHLRNPIQCKRPESSNKSLNLYKVQESKSTASKGFYGSTGLGRAENLLKKGFGGRPKSLSVTSSATGVNKLWRSPSKTGRSEPIGPRPESVGETGSPEHGEHFFKTYNASSSSRDISSTSPCTNNEKWRSEESDDHCFKKFKKDASSTLPCTSIPNVMECQSHKYKASDLTQAPGEDCEKGKAFQEMVPLFPSISVASQIKKEIPLEIAKRMKNYQAEYSRIKRKGDYCSRKMAYHLCKLREVIMGQEINDKDKAIAALDELARVRDILDDKLPLTPDSLHQFSAMEDLIKEASAMTLENNLGGKNSSAMISTQKHARTNSAPSLFLDIHKCD